MSQRFFVSLGALAVVVGAVALLTFVPVAAKTTGAQAGGDFDPPRTAWGHPDLQGIWTSNAVTGVPVERPKETLTAEDVARRDEGYVIYEYACHEGNYGLAHILSAALKQPQ